MAQVPSAVSVVTCALDGQPYGATVSAFESLSIDPPMMLVALNRHSRLLHIIFRACRFRINVLSAGQQEIADRFASKLSPDRFIGRGWKYDDGLPLLFDAQAWITCALGEVLKGGDHAILLGYVKDAAAQPKPPLVHYARTYGTYSPCDDGQLIRRFEHVNHRDVAGGQIPSDEPAIDLEGQRQFCDIPWARER